MDVTLNSQQGGHCCGVCVSCVNRGAMEKDPGGAVDQICIKQKQPMNILKESFENTQNE